MLAWAVAAPILFGILLVVLARLEDWVVAPIDRAERISRMLETSDPDQLEHAVAEYLSPVVSPRRTLVRGLEPASTDTDTKPIALPGLRKRSA